jgi:glycosyltransferase involved in cell wall biosynthesis
MEKYSVLMSVYCKEKAEYFRQAIDSMLSQTVQPDEFVLVCDGPLTPELDAMINEYKQAQPELFKVIRLEENRGLGIALSVGLQECSHELVARMDTDDISLPDRLEKQLSLMQANPQISAVGGQIAEFYDDPETVMDYRIVPQTHEDIYKRASSRNPMNHMTVVYKKSHVMESGNYDDHPGFEDYHLWVKMLSKGYRFMNIPDVCCHVRTGEGLAKRRCGVSYFRHTWRMEKLLREKGMLTLFQFWKNVSVRFVGTVLLPPCMIRVLYKKTMRQSKKSAH